MRKRLLLLGIIILGVIGMATGLGQDNAPKDCGDYEGSVKGFTSCLATSSNGCNVFSVGALCNYQSGLFVPKCAKITYKPSSQQYVYDYVPVGIFEKKTDAEIGRLCPGCPNNDCPQSAEFYQQISLNAAPPTPSPPAPAPTPGGSSLGFGFGGGTIWTSSPPPLPSYGSTGSITYLYPEQAGGGSNTDVCTYTMPKDAVVYFALVNLGTWSAQGATITIPGSGPEFCGDAQGCNEYRCNTYSVPGAFSGFELDAFTGPTATRERQAFSMCPAACDKKDRTGVYAAYQLLNFGVVVSPGYERLYVSQDRGKSWARAVAKGLLGIERPANVEGGKYMIVGTDKVYFSPDYGKSWAEISTPGTKASDVPTKVFTTWYVGDYYMTSSGSWPNAEGQVGLRFDSLAGGGLGGTSVGVNIASLLNEGGEQQIQGESTGFVPGEKRFGVSFDSGASWMIYDAEDVDPKTKALITGGLEEGSGIVVLGKRYIYSGGPGGMGRFTPDMVPVVATGQCGTYPDGCGGLCDTDCQGISCGVVSCPETQCNGKVTRKSLQNHCTKYYDKDEVCVDCSCSFEERCIAGSCGANCAQDSDCVQEQEKCAVSPDEPNVGLHNGNGQYFTRPSLGICQECVCRETAWVRTGVDTDGDGIDDQCDTENTQEDCNDGVDNDGNDLCDDQGCGEMEHDPSCEDLCPSCDLCGAGAFDFCDRDECSTCGACLYNQVGTVGFAFGTCEACDPLITCEDYGDDKISCEEDPCPSTGSCVFDTKGSRCCTDADKDGECDSAVAEIKKSCDPDEVPIVRVDDVGGSQAGLLESSDLPLVLCIDGPEGLGNDCSGNHDVLFKLSAVDNALTAQDESDFPYPVCLSSGVNGNGAEVDCFIGEAEDCQDAIVVASLQSPEGGGLIASPVGYVQKVCCKLTESSSEACDDGIDNDGDGTCDFEGCEAFPTPDPDCTNACNSCTMCGGSNFDLNLCDRSECLNCNADCVFTGVNTCSPCDLDTTCEDLPDQGQCEQELCPKLKGTCAWMGDSCCTDADKDGICDPVDQCIGGESDIDTNGNGVPDACEGCHDGDGVCSRGCNAGNDVDCADCSGLEKDNVCPKACSGKNDVDCSPGCVDNDVQCPIGCNAGNDNDCLPDDCSGTDRDELCPEGCDASNDIDCPAGCTDGDGVCGIGCNYGNDKECVRGECKGDAQGVCPIGCDASNDIDCLETCIDDDGICPRGCNGGADTDCLPNGCSGKTSDLSCPQGCDASNDVDCGEACRSNDGICPIGCTIALDNDCGPKACSGLVEDAVCPNGCDRSNDIDCSGLCLHGDGVCAIGCHAGNDEDCTNGECSGVLRDGDCPLGCSSTNDADCDVACVDDDNLCPIGCNAGTDTDCSTKTCSGAERDQDCPPGCDRSNDMDCRSVCQDLDDICPVGCNAVNDLDCGPVICSGVRTDFTCPVGCDSTIDIDCPGGCINNDDKCPIGCNFGNDNDCAGMCSGAAEDGLCSPNCDFTNDKDCPFDCFPGDARCGAGCNAGNDPDCTPGECSGTEHDGGCPIGCDSSNDIDCHGPPCEDGDNICPIKCTTETDNDCLGECGGDPDNSYCGCEAFNIDEVNALCDYHGEVGCWSTIYGCCGDDEGETWVLESENSLLEVLPEFSCINGKYQKIGLEEPGFYDLIT